MEERGAKILVIGIGNERRGDDAAGLLAARRLRDRGIAGVDVVEAQGEGTGLLDQWAAAETVYIIDAVFSGAPPGSCFRLDARRRIPAGLNLQCSTHGFGVAAAIELARALNRLPRTLIIYGIEGAKFRIGEAISVEAQRGVEATVAAILEDLGDRDGKARPCTNGD